jgi:hypothetical protein
MKTLFISLTLLVFSLPLLAQDALEPRRSPFWSTHHQVNDTYIKITYGRPHKNNRKIFGKDGIVKYGEIWRTGANESTEIHVNHDIKIGAEKLYAGTYSLYTIPGEKEWIIIINKGLGHWGTAGYNQEEDVLRITVPVQTSKEAYEPFTIEIVDKEGGKKFNIMLVWDTTMILIPVEVF